MTEELRHGSLDTEFSISDERARELLAQIAAGDAEKPFTELSEAYGHHVRRILAARVKDKTELEDVLQDFWIHVAQNAGKYGGKAPVKRWLLVIASRLGIASYRRLSRRQKRVLYRAEMASKMPDAGEEDDLDLERLADESIESLRSIQPDESMEQEEKEAASRRLVQYLEQSEDRATRLLYRRYIEGASCKQMAEEEHIKPKTMRTRVSYSMASMRQTLIDVYQGGTIWNMRISNPRSLRRIYGFGVVGCGGIGESGGLEAV